MVDFDAEGYNIATVNVSAGVPMWILPEEREEETFQETAQVC